MKPNKQVAWILMVLIAFAPAVQAGPFISGQVLTASQLNTVVDSKTDNASAAITGGTISGATISTPSLSLGGISLSSSVGASAVGFSQAGSGAVATTVQSKLRESVSVIDFGADTTGISTSVTAFQNAIDSTPNSGIQVIHVPRGTYLGNMTTLTYGSRTVVWQEEGGVTYSTAAPSVGTATRVNAYRAGDAARPWIEGKIGFNSGAGQTTADDFADVRVDRTADYSATASGVTHAMRVNTDISSTVGTVGTRKPEWALTAQITNNSDNANAVALTGQAIRNATSPVWGGQFVGKCTIANPATYYSRAFEADINAEGADTNNRRVIADFIGHNTAAATYTGTDQIYAGIRIEAGTALIKNGIVVDESPGVVTNGIVVSNTGTSGYIDNGAHAGAAMVLSGSGTLGLNISSGTWSAAAIRVGLDKKIDLSSNGSAWISDTTASAGVEIGYASTVQAKIAAGVQIGAPTGNYKGTGTLNYASGIYQNGVLLSSATAPTIASGFGTTPSVVSGNGTATFTINVGTGGTASSGVVTMPAATTGWNCTVTPTAAPQAGAVMYSAPTSTTSITITNYTLSTGAALAWPASTVIAVSCVGY